MDFIRFIVNGQQIKVAVVFSTLVLPSSRLLTPKPLVFLKPHAGAFLSQM